jgi:hypothetical protein
MRLKMSIERRGKAVTQPTRVVLTQSREDAKNRKGFLCGPLRLRGFASDSEVPGTKQNLQALQDKPIA